MTEVTIRWPFDNTLHEAPLSPDQVELVLARLREAGIPSQHSTERVELVDVITGTPTGYIHCSERFVVDPRHEYVARGIVSSALD